MYKTVIIDDEVPAIDELIYHLSKDKQFKIVKTITDPQQGILEVLNIEPDVIFLDIDMPQIKGYTLAEIINKMPNAPLIIFVTAHDEFAVKAFEVNATDYILKPINEERFKVLLVKIRNILGKRKMEKSNTRVPLWNGDKIALVDVDDIYFITNNEKELIIQTNTQIFYKKDTLSNFLEELPNQFFRSHRNYIINLNNIEEIIPWFNNTYTVKFPKFSEQLPVSRRNIKEFKEKLDL